VEPIPVGTGVRLGVERGAQVLGLDELLDGGQPGRCQSPSRGQPLDALLVCFGPAAATLSRGDQQLGAVGVEAATDAVDPAEAQGLLHDVVVEAYGPPLRFL
jgi:hypothetical protein